MFCNCCEGKGFVEVVYSGTETCPHCEGTGNHYEEDKKK